MWVPSYFESLILWMFDFTRIIIQTEWLDYWGLVDTEHHLQASASDWDAQDSLPLLWVGGDDSAAAQERRHQSRPVHCLAGYHDQGDFTGSFTIIVQLFKFLALHWQIGKWVWLTSIFRTCLLLSSSEATSSLSSPSTPSSLAGHENKILFIDYLFFHHFLDILKLHF